MTTKKISKGQQRDNETMAKIIDRYQSGKITEPLATMYIQRQLGAAPMINWSWLNQFACVIAGCIDARGFRQWEEVGRSVIKGERAATYILFPLMRKEEEERPNGETEEVKKIYGFKGAAVFDVTQTEGDPLESEADLAAERAFLQSLPLYEVAEHLGVKVNTYSGKEGFARGRYSNRGGRELISLGVENVDTWLHELIHLADDRQGNLKERGQHWRSETVAQFGAATLAILLGMEYEANLGKTYSYIEAYAEAASLSVIQACTKVLERTMQAVTFIMDTAQALHEKQPEPEAG